jgi:cytoskeletal protein RodZ
VQSFGERLRKEREKQSVTLDEVCVSTKIAVRFLTAIEEERFERLPGGIFNKGFVRAYAQHLGINEDEAVADYLKAAGLLPTVPLNTTPPGEVDTKVPETKNPEIKAAPVQAPGLAPDVKKAEAKPVETKQPAAKAPVEAAAAMVEAKPPKPKSKGAKRQSRQEKKKQPEPVRHPEAEPDASNEHWFPWGRVAFALLLIAFGFAMWGSFHRESEEHTSQPVAQSAVNQSVIAPEPQALQNVNTEPATIVSGQAEAAPATGSPQTAAAPMQESATVPNGSFLVVVQAREDSWVSIVVDGREVMKDFLDAPTEKAVEAHKEVVIKAGNVGALDFVFNGKKLPSQGEYDEVKILTFDPNGLQSQPAKTAGL